MISTTLRAATSGDDSRSFFERVGDAIAGASGTLVALAAIAVGALFVWLLGRIAIRALVRSIEDGVPWTERRAARRAARGDAPPPRQEPHDRFFLDRRRQRANTIGAVLGSVWGVMVVGIAAMMMLSRMSVDVAPIIASAGIVGVALGFGAQSLVRDVLAGVFILAEDQYGIGDVVDLGEASGSVEHVGLRTTRLRGLDGTVWFVPNGEIKRVGNRTKVFSRAVLDVRFAYDTDVAVARTALMDAVAAAAEDPTVAAAIIGEADVPGVEQLDYDAVILRLLVEVEPGKQWLVQRAVREALIPILAERTLRLAVPDHTLYLDQEHPANTGPELPDSAG